MDILEKIFHDSDFFYKDDDFDEENENIMIYEIFDSIKHNIDINLVTKFYNRKYDFNLQEFIILIHSLDFLISKRLIDAIIILKHKYNICDELNENNRRLFFDLKLEQTIFLSLCKYQCNVETIEDFFVENDKNEALKLSNNIEICKLLLDKGADKDCGLRFASENGNFEIVELLLNRNANIHTIDDYSLRFATYYGHFNVVKLLLDYGANMNIYDDCILRWSCQKGYLNILQLLLDKGMDIYH